MYRKNRETRFNLCSYITSDHDRIQFKFASKVEGLILNLKMKFLKFACKENKQLFL